MLLNSSARNERGLFIIEGARLCHDAVLSGAAVEKAFFTPRALEKYPLETGSIFQSASASYEINESVAQRLSDTKNPQGVFCVCKILDKFEYIDKINYNGLYVLTESVQNPDNLGAISRTAEAFGIDGLIVCSGCDIYSPKALRASMGALMRLPVYTPGNAAETLRFLRERGMDTVASVARADALPVTLYSPQRGAVLVIGNEGAGISPEAEKECSVRVTVPMRGRAESLNASAAAAVLLWELSSHRK